MVKSGIVKQADGKLTVNVPVFTGKQYQKLLDILKPIKEQLHEMSYSAYNKHLSAHMNHVPAHLKDYALSWAPLNFYGIMLTVMKYLHTISFLKIRNFMGEFPAACVVLRDIL